jgi:hypothetical protein
MSRVNCFVVAERTTRVSYPVPTCEKQKKIGSKEETCLNLLWRTRTPMSSTVLESHSFRTQSTQIKSGRSHGDKPLIADDHSLGAESLLASFASHRANESATNFGSDRSSSSSSPRVCFSVHT